ncbi:RNA polymerase subunit RPO18, partial [Monkeypox virus]
MSSFVTNGYLPVTL